MLHFGLTPAYTFMQILLLCTTGMAMRQFLAMRIIRIASASAYYALICLINKLIIRMNPHLPHPHGHT